MINPDIKIWCTYHMPEQITEYNIKETDIIKLFYSDNESLKEENINDLNGCLSEIVTYYYVWKNQKYSKYVGFCHYRRHFNCIDFDFINDNNVQAYFSWKDNFLGYKTSFGNPNYCKQDVVFNHFIDYIKTNCGIDTDKLIRENNLINVCSNISYIFTWNVFNDVCEFLFGFLDYLGNILNVNWKTIEGISKINGYFYKDEITTGLKFDRELSIILEYVISAYICIKYNVISHRDKNDNIQQTYIFYKDINPKLFCEISKKNVKCSPLTIYLLNNEYENLDIYKYLNTYSMTYKDLHNILKNIRNTDNIFFLKPNEFIDCDDFYQFYKGNYKISTI